MAEENTQLCPQPGFRLSNLSLPEQVFGNVPQASGCPELTSLLSSGSFSAHPARAAPLPPFQFPNSRSGGKAPSCMSPARLTAKASSPSPILPFHEVITPSGAPPDPRALQVPNSSLPAAHSPRPVRCPHLLFFLKLQSDFLIFFLLRLLMTSTLYTPVPVT